MPKREKTFQKAKKARKRTETIADNNLVPGAKNTKKLRDKTADALKAMGL